MTSSRIPGKRKSALVLWILPPYINYKSFRTATQSSKHTLTSCFYKNILKNDICILLWKYFLRQIYSYNFYIYKLNNLKIIDDLCFQYLIQTLSKTTSKYYTEEVHSGCLCRHKGMPWYDAMTSQLTCASLVFLFLLRLGAAWWTKSKGLDVTGTFGIMVRRKPRLCLKPKPHISFVYKYSLHSNFHSNYKSF